jgi:hypothetical protein
LVPVIHILVAFAWVKAVEPFNEASLHAHVEIMEGVLVLRVTVFHPPSFSVKSLLYALVVVTIDVSSSIIV